MPATAYNNYANGWITEENKKQDTVYLYGMYVTMYVYCMYVFFFLKTTNLLKSLYIARFTREKHVLHIHIFNSAITVFPVSNCSFNVPDLT